MLSNDALRPRRRIGQPPAIGPIRSPVGRPEVDRLPRARQPGRVPQHELDERDPTSLARGLEEDDPASSSTHHLPDVTDDHAHPTTARAVVGDREVRAHNVQSLPRSKKRVAMSRHVAVPHHVGPGACRLGARWRRSAAQRSSQRDHRPRDAGAMSGRRRGTAVSLRSSRVASRLPRQRPSGFSPTEGAVRRSSPPQRRKPRNLRTFARARQRLAPLLLMSLHICPRAPRAVLRRLRPPRAPAAARAPAA